MLVQLTPEQCSTLVRLVDDAMEELGPEIHHTMTRTYKDDLKEQRRALRMLRDALSGAAGPAPTVVESSDALGTA